MDGGRGPEGMCWWGRAGAAALVVGEPAARLTPRGEDFCDLFANAGRNVAGAARILVRLADPGGLAPSLRHAAEARTCWWPAHASNPAPAESSFIAPFDRGDIYRLVGGLHDVMDDTTTGRCAGAIVSPVRCARWTSRWTAEQSARRPSAVHRSPRLSPPIAVRYLRP
jgi:hypothetical protein